MKNEKLKILKMLFIISIIIINIFLILPNISYAIGDVTINPDIWNPTSVGSSGSIGTKIAPVLGMIKFIGITISVITLSVIGLKIMFGSVEEKAKYKETLMPWLLGAFMVFSMATIPDIIYNFAADKPGDGLKEETKDGGYAKPVDICAGGNIMTRGECTTPDCKCKNAIEYGTYQCSKCGLILGNDTYCERCSDTRRRIPVIGGQNITKSLVCKYRMGDY